jgi:hypothetical protein
VVDFSSSALSALKAEKTAQMLGRIRPGLRLEDKATKNIGLQA